jgi:hypothetical protein
MVRTVVDFDSVAIPRNSLNTESRLPLPEWQPKQPLFGAPGSRSEGAKLAKPQPPVSG